MGEEYEVKIARITPHFYFSEQNHQRKLRKHFLGSDTRQEVAAFLVT